MKWEGMRGVTNIGPMAMFGNGREPFVLGDPNLHTTRVMAEMISEKLGRRVSVVSRSDYLA